MITSAIGEGEIKSLIGECTQDKPGRRRRGMEMSTFSYRAE
jgi:hypothetical protein